MEAIVSRSPPNTLFHVYHILLAFDETLDQIKMDTDADFELQRLSMFYTNGGGAQTAESRAIAQVNFNIRDQATGRNLFSGFADTGELFGDGTVPFVLPTTHFFKRGGKALFLYDAVTPGTDFGVGSLHLQLIGRKLYDLGRSVS